MPDLTIAIAAIVGAFCIGVAIGSVSHRPSSPRGNYHPRRPEQPLATDLIRYTRWRDEQIRRAVTEPIRFDEGPIARSTSGAGPTTPKPDIVPGFHGSGSRRTTRRFINNPVQIAECGGPCTAGPKRCDCGALWCDVPTEPQPPGGRVTDVYDRTIGYQPRPQGSTPNPPPTDP